MNEFKLRKKMEAYQRLVAELQPQIDDMNRLKKEIQDAIKERGETLEHGSVTATLRNGYTRTTWDGKSLNGYAVANPEILTFRTEKQIGPSVAVKVKT